MVSNYKMDKVALTMDKKMYNLEEFLILHKISNLQIV